MLNPVLADLLRAEGQAAFDFGFINGQASGRAGYKGGSLYADGRAVLGTPGVGDAWSRLQRYLPNDPWFLPADRRTWSALAAKKATHQQMVAGINNLTHYRSPSGSARRNMYFSVYAPRRSTRSVYRKRSRFTTYRPRALRSTWRRRRY